jgi:FRG domain
MALVDDFFAPWEQEVSTFDEIHSLLGRLYDKWIKAGRTIAWRGSVRADWPLHSSLYRRLYWSSPNPAPEEPAVRKEEERLLTSVHRWGLHNGSRGRLSVLEQLATLQHFGAPTRLIDVSMNAYVGLWFAVEEVWRNGERADEDSDGRLFAIDVSRRLINETDDERRWEDELHRPWKGLDARDWQGKTRAWRPPPFEARIAAQHGAFLFGGVPRAGVGIVWPKGTGVGAGTWALNDVRQCISIPLRFHKADPGAGGVPAAGGQPAYTFRIKASAKADIRRKLAELFGYTHRTIYPDYPGFARHAMQHLHTAAP